MVNSKALNFYLFLCVSLITLPSFAETTLNASVDRSKIYEMDTLNLTIQGQVDMDFSFGGLMNFGLGQSESPDTNGLEKDFEILDQQQSYNMQSINGDSKAQIVWRYTLAPKNVGVLEIPSMKYKGAETTPISISVIEGKAPKNASAPPAIFIEVETDKSEAYVQEQIIYTLRLYTQGLVNGELSEPSSNDAIIEQFGDQKKYYRMAYNQRYEVVERQYLIFPQKSGNLTIDKQTFQGVSLKHGRRTRMKDVSDPVTLTIKPPAPGFSGQNWLPATSLFLNEEWQGDINTLQVGDSITRKIELSALGLLGSALPPINMPDSPLYKLYTDKPSTESVLHESGSQAQRTDSFAIVAIKEGEIQLDEIKIPWWDTVNDVERVAIIPAKNIVIAANPDLPVTPPAKAIEQPSSATTTTNEDINETDSLPSSSSTTNHLWQTVAGVLLLLWLGTSFYLITQIKQLKRKLNAIPTPKQKTTEDEKALFSKAVNACKTDDKAMPQAILTWIETTQKASYPSTRITSLQDIEHIAPVIYQQLKAYELDLYSPSTSTNFNKSMLIEALKAFRQQATTTTQKAKQGNKKTLESFYQ